MTDTGMSRWDELYSPKCFLVHLLLLCFTSTVSDHQPSFLFFPRITFWPTTGLAVLRASVQTPTETVTVSEQSEHECLLSLSREEQKHKRWNRLEQFGSWVGFHFQKLADAETLKLVSK